MESRIEIVAALLFLLQCLVLNRDRLMPISSAPFRQRLERSLESTPRRLALASRATPITKSSA